MQNARSSMRFLHESWEQMDIIIDLVSGVLKWP
jgi:hypothetical protein